MKTLNLYDLRNAYSAWKDGEFTNSDLAEYKDLFKSMLKEYNVGPKEWSIAQFEYAHLLRDCIPAPTCVSPITGYTYTDEDIFHADMPAVYVKYTPNDEWKFLF